MILRNRGYLPHIEAEDCIYFVTFRLAGSLPASVLEAWNFEREDIKKTAHQQKRELSDYEKRRLNYLYLEKVENYLDSGRGECWLGNPEIAKIIIDALHYFNQDRYILHAWCVMPNHVHVVFSPLKCPDQSSANSLLISILHSWKSFTSTKANQFLKRKGKFWQEEYFDTLVKTEKQFWFYVRYVLENPVSAKLCRKWDDWKWSGCSQEIKRLLQD